VVQVRNKQGDLSTAVLKFAVDAWWSAIPSASQKTYPELILTAIHSHGEILRKIARKIDWKLLTDLPVRTRQEATEKLDWYAQRWKIETFHKILKSGCKADRSEAENGRATVNLMQSYAS